jgi:hypothetical protein
MGWVPEQPIRLLPEIIREHFRDDALFLLGELESNRLEVILVPAPDPKHTGHMIRAVENRNPGWYSNLYWSYNHFRRDKSVRSLNRIIEERDGHHGIVRFKYDWIYRSIMQERLIDGFRAAMGYKVPPNNEVRDFFGFEPVKEEDFVPY